MRHAASLTGHKIAVGWAESAKYSDGLSVAENAATHEYGSPSNGIPARPFMRPAIAVAKRQLPPLIKEVTFEVMTGKKKANQALQIVGVTAKGLVLEALTNPRLKPLSETTLASRASKNASGKASTTPLNDTGFMIASLDFEVTK